MNKIDRKILIINNAICTNIATYGNSERGLLSQNILAQLRHLVEHISLKIYANGADLDVLYDNIKKGIEHINKRGDLRLFRKFHELIQRTNSHYTLETENSERLMLKYYEYLLKIKLYLKRTYNFNILENLSDFPINTDSTLKEYYEKIAVQIENSISLGESTQYDDRYYIQKIKPFFINDEIYYEVTFTIANDKASKFDRIIAFTKIDIMHNYAVKLSIRSNNVTILEKEVPILIIDKWNVSIRNCEIKNLAKIFGIVGKFGGTNEYHNLMKELTVTGFNLAEIVDLPESLYRQIMERIISGGQKKDIMTVLDKCRLISQDKMPGHNIIRYLLYRMNNTIIKKQYNNDSCGRLSNLYLSYSCMPFDEMPFDTSLIGHNPKLSNLFDCIDSTNREHEFFARLIKNNTEQKGQLYTPIDDLMNCDDINSSISKFNEKLYYKHQNRKLENYKNHIYIKGYEENTVTIVKQLQELTIVGIDNYSASVEAWLLSSTHIIDCSEKKEAMIRAFEKSKVALIYGAAGTGKSTFINHISFFLQDKNKLYLAKTNPAVENMKRKVVSANSTYMTIDKFMLSTNSSVCDLLVIDECSTVSNVDMLNVLNKANFKLLLLVGDVFQIESIIFGNWFTIAKEVIPSTAITELKNPYRSTNIELLTLWNIVRNAKDDIFVHISKNNYSTSLNESIFENTGEDEIILCLNYDGLYGINNINRFLQCNNINPSIQWGIQTYKVGDPILFNEVGRFTPLLYNNLKGKIVDIEKSEDTIRFDIEIDKALNGLDVDGYALDLIENSNNNSIIRFYVYKNPDPDNDDDNSSSDTVVPFQIAYAVSIHKAQGLEYESVKIVITDETEEMITHNIFYTAITRAKEKLKIYWSPEIQNKVLNKLERKFNGKDIGLLKSKFDL